jgi:carboxypeptidase Taq
MTAYQELERSFRRLADLRGAEAVLQWDWATMMPPGGAKARGEQLATLGLLAHELITDAALSDWLDEAEAAANGLNDWQAANLFEMRRRWRHANAVPADLVEALSRASTACELAWREARPADDFKTVAPLLDDLMSLVRQQATAKADALGVAPYDALLDAYDPGLTAAIIEPIFAELAAFLPNILERVQARQAAEPAPMVLSGDITVEAQRTLAEDLMVRIGFDTDHGRLDVSHHPFTAGVPDDIRITTRYRDGDFTESLMAVVHETGHALYERGLPADWRGQPVGEALGMTIHESQSLLLEMQAGRTDAFINFIAPMARAAFRGIGAAWEVPNLRRTYRRVEPGFIRVEADEVTYSAHILLRTKIEQALLSGDLAVADLPGAWRERMRALLGVDVPNDKDGCMQDIHWYSGAVGYFPTYTLGALAAAQLFAAATGADGAILKGIAAGDFAPLFVWLRENVHGHGSRLPTDLLLQRATGQKLGVEAFRAHLEARYLS